jgi:hypothetical protein
VQSLVVVLVSVNRLGSWTEGYVARNEFLRWVDLLNMVLALASLIAFYLLKNQLRGYDAQPTRRAHNALGVGFIVGAYLLAASYGSHEVTNYLHVRFCPDTETSRLCAIIAYHDDGFSHLMFFAGFTVINLVIMFTQVAAPWRGRLTVADSALIVLNAAFIGAGIFANLSFEEIGLDLYVVAAIAVLAVGLLWRRRDQPILRYYAVAYVLGLVATAIAKLA